MRLFRDSENPISKKENRHERSKHVCNSEDRFHDLEELYWRNPNAQKGKIARRERGKENHDMHSDTGL